MKLTRKLATLALIPLSIGFVFLALPVLQNNQPGQFGGTVTALSLCTKGVYHDERGYVGVLLGGNVAEAAPCGYTDVDAVNALQSAPTVAFTGVISFLGGLTLSDITLEDDGLHIENPAGTFTYDFQGSALLADRVVTLPLLTGPATFAFTDFIQTWGAAQDFNSQALTNVNIDSGSVDNSIIGAGTPAAGTFTVVTVDNLGLNGNTLSSSAAAITLNPTTDVLVANGSGLIVGHTVGITAGSLAEYQVLGGARLDSSAIFGRFEVGTGGPTIDFVKSDQATIGAFQVVDDDDNIGQLGWFPDDGFDYATQAAVFRGEVDDATPAAGDIGMAFVWVQMPGGGVGSRETLRLSAAGDLSLAEGFIELNEVSAPASGSANTARIYAVANGAKTDLEVIFQTGSGVTIAVEATEPTDSIVAAPSESLGTIVLVRPHPGIVDIVLRIPGFPDHVLTSYFFHDAEKISWAQGAEGPLPNDWLVETTSERSERTCEEKGDTWKSSVLKCTLKVAAE